MGRILGLTAEEIVAVYQSLLEMVLSRTAKAKSLGRERATKEGLDLDLFVENIFGHLREHNLAAFFNDHIATAACYSLNLPRPARPIEIENTLLGWRLKVGKRSLDCSSEAQARYLRVFAEMGWDHALVPKDDTYLSSLIREWEDLFEKAQSTLEEYTGSILQAKTRARAIEIFWARVREEVGAAGDTGLTKR